MRQRGFSLLELLVAITIMGMSLGLIYRVAGGSARHVTDIVQQQQAAWLAESLLASRTDVRADGWNDDGESSNFKWHIRSAPYAAGINAPHAVPLHEIRLLIEWDAGSHPGQIELVTLLPERKPAPGDVVR